MQIVADQGISAACLLPFQMYEKSVLRHCASTGVVMHTRLMSTTSIAAITIATGLATAAFAPTALADGYEPVGPAIESRPVVRWEGLYLGAHVGSGEAHMDAFYSRADNAGFESEPHKIDNIDPNGVLAGFHGGYNWQFGRGVFGIEGDWSFMDWHDRKSRAIDFTTSEGASGDIDNLASVRARLGYAVGHDHSVLLFVSGGVAWADADGRVCDDKCGITDTDFTGSDIANFSFNDVGGVVGAGFEYAMTHGFRLRVDGSYYWFNDSQTKRLVREVNPGVVQTEIFRHNLDTAYTFRVGGTWYFTQEPQAVVLK